MPNDISLEGFDDDSITFIVRGASARALAKTMGDPFGYAPLPNTTVVVNVTIFPQGLTDEVVYANFHQSTSGDAQSDLFNHEGVS
jgi:hypothetical protein